METNKIKYFLGVLPVASRGIHPVPNIISKK
jgi:hypothetical protein